MGCYITLWKTRTIILKPELKYMLKAITVFSNKIDQGSVVKIDHPDLIVFHGWSIFHTLPKLKTLNSAAAAAEF